MASIINVRSCTEYLIRTEAKAAEAAEALAEALARLAEAEAEAKAAEAAKAKAAEATEAAKAAKAEAAEALSMLNRATDKAAKAAKAAEAAEAKVKRTRTAKGKAKATEAAEAAKAKAEAAKTAVLELADKYAPLAAEAEAKAAEAAEAAKFAESSVALALVADKAAEAADKAEDKASTANANVAKAHKTLDLVTEAEAKAKALGVDITMRDVNEVPAVLGFLSMLDACSFTEISEAKAADKTAALVETSLQLVHRVKRNGRKVAAVVAEYRIPTKYDRFYPNLVWGVTEAWTNLATAKAAENGNTENLRTIKHKGESKVLQAAKSRPHKALSLSSYVGAVKPALKAGTFHALPNISDAQHYSIVPNTSKRVD